MLAPDLTVGRTHMWRPARIVAWPGPVRPYGKALLYRIQAARRVAHRVGSVGVGRAVRFADRPFDVGLVFADCGSIHVLV